LIEHLSDHVRNEDKYIHPLFRAVGSGSSTLEKDHFYNDESGINRKDLRRWLVKSRQPQCDYKDFVRRRGRLERMK